MGRYDEALAHAESALAGKPSYAAAYYLAGKVLERKGKGDQAARAYAQCLELGESQELKENAKKAVSRLTPKA